MKDAFPDLTEMLQKQQEESQTHEESNPSNGFNLNRSTRVGEGMMEMYGSSHSVGGGGENGYNRGAGGALNGNSNGSNGEVKMEE